MRSEQKEEEGKRRREEMAGSNERATEKTRDIFSCVNGGAALSTLRHFM